MDTVRPWPHPYRFAFSIFDDTDGMTVQSGRPVYDLLTRLGLRVTKSVWPLGAHLPQTVGGSACDDPEYLAWVRDVRSAGHEIGFHLASDHSSERDRTRAALDRFVELFGDDPRVGADHAGNRESLAAGSDRLSGWRRGAYRVAERVLQPDRPRFEGTDPESPWFWGDLCRERIEYWRGLTFARTDLTDLEVRFPYHDIERPFVNQWFLSCDAPLVGDLLDRLRPAELDRLERQGGVCLLYTHLGLDASKDGMVHPGLVRALSDLSDRGGWCVPVSELLDRMCTTGTPNGRVITDSQRSRLERRWVLDRLRSRVRVGPKVQTCHSIE